jgi:hypothetical protein
MNKHTEGPWLYNPVGDEDGIDYIVEVGRWEIYAPGEADARLIASAPDLLKAAKSALHEILWITDQTDQGRLEAIERLQKAGNLQAALRAAIAEAEAGQS